MAEKREYIQAWFNEIQETLDEIELLIKAERKHFERIVAPALYALIERMAEIRYRLHEKMGSGKRFKELLVNYSGKKKELQRIDLVFLCKWSSSSYKNVKLYKESVGHIHNKIKKALQGLYHDITVSMDNRYVDANHLYSHLKNNKICPICLKKESLNLFSMNEVIYRFGRCDTVHKLEFGYVSASYLHFLAKQACENLQKICIENEKWPYELDDRSGKQKS